MDANASTADLLTRMRALEDEIVSRNVSMKNAGPSMPDDLRATYATRAQAPSPPAPPQTFDSSDAAITHVNLVAGHIGTTLGEFPLDEKEIAQIAFIGVQAVGRNLQAMLTKMGQDHGVPQLQAEIDRQQEEIAKMVRESHGARANGASPVAPPVPPQPFDDAEAIGDDFDETGPTPIPLNKPRPKRGRPAKS